MDALTRKLALRNAAKVAFGSLFVGCGGTIAGPADVTPLPDAHVEAGTDAADADAHSATLACTGPVDVDASVDQPTFECCLGVVEELTGDAGFTVVDAGAVAADPSVDNCCKAIIAHVDTSTGDWSAASNVLPTCCGAEGRPMGPACTPWGPPTPPEMEVA